MSDIKTELFLAIFLSGNINDSKEEMIKLFEKLKSLASQYQAEFKPVSGLTNVIEIFSKDCFYVSWGEIENQAKKIVDEYDFF